jgi:hypothetical protein
LTTSPVTPTRPKNEPLHASAERARVRDNAMRAATVSVTDTVAELGALPADSSPHPAVAKALAALDRAQRHLTSG